MPLEFIETGNQNLDDDSKSNNWKAPRYDFKTVFYKESEIKKRDGVAIKLDETTILVDFDEFPEIGMAIAKKYPTFSVLTDRGIHLYYTKPKTYKGRIPSKAGALTNCGALVDYKTGKNAMGTLKVKGKVRDYVKPMPKELSELPELPEILYPHKYMNKGDDKKLSGLDDGDGRNNALLSHMWALREKWKFEQYIVETVMEFINDSVFGSPLPKSELKTLEKQVMNKESTSDSQLVELNPKGNPEGTWKALVEILDIKVYMNTLYYKVGEKYRQDVNYLKRAVNELVWLPSAQMEEFLKQALVLGERVDEKEFHIQLRNNHMIRNSPDVVPMNGGFTPYVIDVDYDDKAYDEHVDNFMEFISCGDNDVRMVVEEILGHMLMTQGFPHNVFFITNSKGSNGKSTFLKMVTSWLGDERTSNLSIEGFNDPTSLLSLEGKLANLGDDIDAVYLDKSKNFKTLASGDIIETRKIYSEPVKFRNKATIVFTANKMPSFMDKTGGIKRRIKIIPFDNSVTEPIAKLDQKLSTDNAKSYLLNLALQGMGRILSNGGKITEAETIKKATHEYFVKSDSVESFIDEFNIIGNAGDETYDMYIQYCDIEGFKQAVAKRTFIERVATHGIVLTKRMGKIGKKSIIITEFVKEPDKVIVAKPKPKKKKVIIRKKKEV